MLIALFLMAIHLPLLIMLMRAESPTVATTENRQLAKFPELALSAASLSSFPTRFNACFEDRFGGRSTLVRWSKLATIHWLGMTPRARSQDDPFDSIAERGALIAVNDATSDNAARAAISRQTGMGAAATTQAEQVLVGEDGWLYYTGAATLDYYRRVRPYRPEELDAWEQAFIERRDWLAARGIEYIVIIAPNKHTIYPEFMPASIECMDRPSHLDRWQERMAAADGPPISHDLRPALMASKSINRVYHRTDSHWNAYGAYIAYSEMIRALAGRIAIPAPWPIEAFDVTTRDGPGGGLANMMGLPDIYREEWIELAPRQPRLAETVLKERRSYPIHIVEHPDKSLPRAVVFHDSFFVRMTPFVGEHFSRLTQAWTYEFDPELIERERPQVVIQELVERVLARFVPQNPPELRLPIQTVNSQATEKPVHR